MKAGDMVMQSEYIARRFDGKTMIFIGDGDSIGLCIAYMRARDVLEYGPKKIVVIDFDDRIVKAVERFADKEQISHLIESRLYNCVDKLPAALLGKFDAFYTNPPWGASNDGESVTVFAERGMEALKANGQGVIVIADDPTVPWSQEVLQRIQRFSIEGGFFVQEMQAQVHQYHLDDAPDLRSCNLFIRAAPRRKAARSSYRLHGKRLENFYGRNKSMRVQYVREVARLEYGKAPDGTYKFEYLKG